MNPAERDAARRRTVIVLTVMVAGLAAITRLVLAYPGTNEMIAMIGP